MTSLERSAAFDLQSSGGVAQPPNPLFPLPAWVLHPAWFVAASVALIWVCVAKNHLFFHDDTYITLRYARHVLAGAGPVWNTTGPRVEGFTSPLHLLLVTVAGALRIPLPMGARMVNVLSHTALVLFVITYLRRRTNRLGASLGGLILAGSWMLLVWDLGGLDAVLYTALSAAGVLTGMQFFEPDEPRPARSLMYGSALLALATLARPEGVLLLASLWGCAALFPGRAMAMRLKPVAQAIAVALVLLLPLVLFRRFYFHQWVPNTFYAKLGGINRGELTVLGLGYLLHFLIEPPYLGILAPLVAMLVIAKRARLSQGDVVLWVMIAIILTFIVVSGGDHMIAYRFCLPLIPLFTAALVIHLYEARLLESVNSGCVVTALMVAALALQDRMHQLNPRFIDPAANVGGVVGRYIAEHWQPGSLVALNTAGSTPYFADGMQYIDMLGLNDAEIARRKNVPESGPWTHLVGHLKGDGASVLARHPDYIILGPANGTTPQKRTKVYFLGDYEIGNSPQFAAEYEACEVPLALTVPNTVPFTFTYFQRRDAGGPCPQYQGDPAADQEPR